MVEQFRQSQWLALPVVAGLFLAAGVWLGVTLAGDPPVAIHYDLKSCQVVETESNFMIIMEDSRNEVNVQVRRKAGR